MFSRLLHSYDAALLANPILVKSATSMTLLGVGDVLSQKLEGNEFNFARTGRMMVWGAGFAVIAHRWYNWLDVMFKGNRRIDIAKKIAADQFVFTPPVNAFFFFIITFMETQNFQQGLHSITAKLWPCLKVNWLVWPGLQAINFSFVPLRLRILFINFCLIFWAAFMSYLANATDEAAAETVENVEEAVEYAVTHPTHPTKHDE